LAKTEESHFLKFFGESLIVFGIILGICILSVAFPPAIVLLPSPLIFIAVRRGFFYSFVPVVLMTAVLWLLLGYVTAAAFLALFTPAVYLVSSVIVKKTRAFESVVISVGSLAVGVGLLIAFVFIIKKTDPMTYLLNSFQYVMQSNRQLPYEFLQIINLQDILMGVKDWNAIISLPFEDALKSAMEALQEILITWLPVMLSSFAVLGGLLNYVIPRSLLKKKNFDVAPIPAFSQFKLPKGFLAGLVITAVLLFLGNYLNIPNVNIMMYACLAAYVIVFSIAGMSFIDYLMKRRNTGTGGRVALIAVVTVLGVLFYSVQFLFAFAILGLLEAVLKIRDRIEKPDDFDGE
jgi:uncharacterized protein YybS (DUF2232 family)